MLEALVRAERRRGIGAARLLGSCSARRSSSGRRWRSSRALTGLIYLVWSSACTSSSATPGVFSFGHVGLHGRSARYTMAHADDPRSQKQQRSRPVPVHSATARRRRSWRCSSAALVAAIVALVVAYAADAAERSRRRVGDVALLIIVYVVARTGTTITGGSAVSPASRRRTTPWTAGSWALGRIVLAVRRDQTSRSAAAARLARGRAVARAARGPRDARARCRVRASAPSSSASAAACSPVLRQHQPRSVLPQDHLHRRWRCSSSAASGASPARSSAP